MAAKCFKQHLDHIVGSFNLLKNIFFNSKKIWFGWSLLENVFGGCFVGGN